MPVANKASRRTWSQIKRVWYSGYALDEMGVA